MATPFGTDPDRRNGRIQRALVYFGLREPPSGALRSEPDSAPRQEPRPDSRKRRALVYFGLVEGSPPSRYGDAVSTDLDDDLDALRDRVQHLEEEVAAIRRSAAPPPG